MMKLFHHGHHHQQPVQQQPQQQQQQSSSNKMDLRHLSVPTLEIVPADEDELEVSETSSTNLPPPSPPSLERPSDLRTSSVSEGEEEGEPKEEKVTLVRKLSRGASFKAIFGGGSKAPKSTPAVSPCATPRNYPSSPSKSPKKGGGGDGSPEAESGSGGGGKQYLQVGAPSSNFKLPKPQVKLLRKTSSVKQLYNSVLHALKTIASASRDDITPELTKTFFENILRASDESPKLVVTKVKVSDAKELGRHFCSEVHTVEVTARVKDGSKPTTEQEVRTYHLVVKSQPQNEDARRFLQPSQTFEKEVQMYAEVFHDMANFVRKESVISLNCKDSEVIDVPRCFYTRWAGEDNMKEDLIILENLYPQGFMYALGQDSGLDRSHSELVIREMAKFHAISYCMKQGSNEEMLRRYSYLSEDSLYRPSTEGFTKRTITPVMASLAELLRTRREYECHHEWFVDLARNFHSIQMRQVQPRNRFAVICHGDLWLSNILFRYCAADVSVTIPVASSDQEQGQEQQQQQQQRQQQMLMPIEVKFLDFQSARFASLATDLVLFLFTSVNSELRRTMLGELISLYYTTFLVSVRSLNVAEEIFSMEELLIEVEDHIIYGFLEGIWYLDILHNGNVPNRDEDDDSDPDDDEEGRNDGGEDDDDLDEDDDGDDDDGDDGGKGMGRTDSTTEDDYEAKELKREEKRMRRRRKRRRNGESEEQRKYREEFFELMDEALFLLGKSDPKASPRDGGHRRSLRDTSLRFHNRHPSGASQSNNGGDNGASNASPAPVEKTN